MSVTAEELQDGLKIPLPAVQVMWREAEELACNSNAISPAPGYDSTSKMVVMSLLQKQANTPAIMTAPMELEFAHALLQ